MDKPYDQEFRGWDHRGAPSSTGLPPAPPSDFQVLRAAESGSETSGAGDTGRSESGAASQELAEACRRRAAGEGFLPLMGRAAPASSRDEGAAREGESTSARTRAVG